MKKVIFVSPHMILGGVEKALLGMFSKMNTEEWDVTALFVRNKGGFSCFIPNRIKIKELNISDEAADRLLGGGSKSAVLYYLKKLKLFNAVTIAIKKVFGHPFPELIKPFSELKHIEGEYDVAVCYHIHMPFLVRFVAEKVSAKKRIAWIHNDFFTTGYNVKKLTRYLDNFDHFFAVSKQLQYEFMTIFPKFKAKTEIFYNILDESDILTKGKYPIDSDMDFEGIKLLSIGRLNPQKGFDIAIDVAQKLVKAGRMDFKWYIIGDGELRSELEKRIKNCDLEGIFILLGSKTNPYPYYKNCDIYVQTSRHEGYVTTVTEAKLFCKPIVVTRVAGSEEQIADGYNGLVTDIDSDVIAKRLIELMDNDCLRGKFIERLREKTSHNDCFVKFEKLWC